MTPPTQRPCRQVLPRERASLPSPVAKVASEKPLSSANLAAALTRRGQRVLVLDADLRLANLDVVLNLHPKITLHDVFTGKARLEDAIIKAPAGFRCCWQARAWSSTRASRLKCATSS